MNFIPTKISEVIIIEPDLYGDERGFFLESWHANLYAENGIPNQFVQDNHSRSRKGVLRGLHYQLNNPQGKLVRVTSGAVFDVAVDIRQGSPTFGEWVGVELSAENHRQVYIPPGFAHGFAVTSDSADFLYKCTDFYSPTDEYGLMWNDPEINIEWPDLDFIISDKDQNNLLLGNATAVLPQYGS